jgi:hypothetical protein
MELFELSFQHDVYVYTPCHCAVCPSMPLSNLSEMIEIITSYYGSIANHKQAEVAPSSNYGSQLL